MDNTIAERGGCDAKDDAAITCSRNFLSNLQITHNDELVMAAVNKDGSNWFEETLVKSELRIRSTRIILSLENRRVKLKEKRK